MKILTNQEIGQIERSTLYAQNISPVELVERAAGALAAKIRTLCNRDVPLIFLAGWGGNGADALEVARLMSLEGYRPVVYLFNIGGNKLNDVCREMRNRLSTAPNATLVEVTGSQTFRWPEISVDSVIVDGLFGAGLNRELPRTFQLLAQNINQSGAMVISIDIPSGLMSEWNGSASRAHMIHADVTLTIEFPRLAFMLGDNAEVVGDWSVVKIGYDPTAVKKAPFTYFLVDRQLVKSHLKERKKFSSKFDYGHAIIFAGCRGMFGAAVLTARGALRAGAGKVTVHSASDCGNILQSSTPSAMFEADSRSQVISAMPLSSKYNAIGVGPGIGKAEETIVAFEKLAKAASAASIRMVVDADALNIIAKRPNILNYLPALSVLTPHAGEFDRLFGKSESDEERLKKAIRCAEDYNLIIVLKGHNTAIIRPDGKIMFNSTGTPAMATAGSGDVLTGVITGLMASGLRSELAAFVGVYAHGLAGEIAAATNGQYGVTAEDIAANIGVAIKQIMES